MSIQAVAWVLDQEGLPQGPKLVLVAIANHADHTDGYCWLKAETIAREAACHPKSVGRTIAALERNGYLRREKRRGADGKQRATDYWLIFSDEHPEWSWHGAADGSADPLDVDEGTEPGNAGLTGEPGNAALTGPGNTDGSSTYTEPSKIKSKEAFQGIGKESPRHYRAPPPNLEIAKPPDLDERVVVIEGTRHWDAMERWWRRAKGLPLPKSYRLEGEHRGKTGRHFRKVDRDAALKTGPPSDSLSDESVAELKATG